MVAENQEEVLVDCLQVAHGATHVQKVRVEVAHEEQSRVGEDLDLQVWVQGHGEGEQHEERATPHEDQHVG